LRDGRHHGAAARTVADVLVAYARECGAAVVVVGSRGRSAIRELVLGSVAMATLHRAYRPVLVVPSRPTGRRPLGSGGRLRRVARRLTGDDRGALCAEHDAGHASPALHSPRPSTSAPRQRRPVPRRSVQGEARRSS